MIVHGAQEMCRIIGMTIHFLIFHKYFKMYFKID